MTIAEFWNAQRFSYLVTYSFNRGPKLAALQEATNRAIKNTQQNLPQARFMQQLKLKRQLAELKQEQQMGAYRRRLTNEQLVIDSTAEAIATVKRGSAVAKRLGELFEAALGEIVYAACPPVYRDALAFYDEQGQLLRVLTICFGCLSMEATDKITVEAGMNTYDALRELLIHLRHPIKSDES